MNVLGVIYSIEAVLPGMLGRGRGQLVAVSSLAALKGLPGESAYCASKAAVNALHGGAADRGAEAGHHGDDDLPGVRRHHDDAHGCRGNAVSDLRPKAAAGGSRGRSLRREQGVVSVSLADGRCS